LTIFLNQLIKAISKKEGDNTFAVIVSGTAPPLPALLYLTLTTNGTDPLNIP
jgi:hypothetical protein